MLRANAFLRGLGEALRKPKRVRGRSMRLVMLQPFPALGDRGDVANGDPPQAVVGLVHLYKPLRAVAEYLDVIRLVGVFSQRIERLPHRHVDHNGRIFVVSDIRSVSGTGLQAPDETRRI